MSAYLSMFNNAQTKVQSQILVGVQFFFSAAVVGLTNRPSVRLSNAGAPLHPRRYTVNLEEEGRDENSSEARR